MNAMSYSQQLHDNGIHEYVETEANGSRLCCAT
jgi:hypothetical protein